MSYLKEEPDSRPLIGRIGDQERRRASRTIPTPPRMRVAGVTVRLLTTAAFLSTPLLVKSQTISYVNDSTGVVSIAASKHLDLTYAPPTQRTEIVNYLFDAYGPYPMTGALFAAGINQLGNAPPEWGEGAEGFGKRFGSDFAIAAVGTTTRYGLAQAFKEDTLYYRCECRGVLPRMSHAVISTLTARRGADGHRVFSLPALVAPYAGAATAVYGWYPNRFGAKDAFRMGNYSLLAFAGENLSLEFFYSGPHSLLSRMHLNNTRASPVEGPNK